MSYKRSMPGTGLMCDGCGCALKEDDVTVSYIRISRQLQNNGIQAELCALCSSKERANGTLLGKFLSDDPFGQPRPS